MKTENVVRDKSYAFAIKIVNIYRHLTEERKEYVLSKQLLRCGTSIGANIEEGIGGQSERDFFTKITIAYKEARECKYWIRLLNETNYLDNKRKEELLIDIEELLRIIGSIQKSMKLKLKI